MAIVNDKIIFDNTPTPTTPEEVALKHLSDTIVHTLGEVEASDVLGLLAGHFVGLTIELLRREGHDTDGPITLDAGDQRHITIHAAGGQNNTPPCGTSTAHNAMQDILTRLGELAAAADKKYTSTGSSIEEGKAIAYGLARDMVKQELEKMPTRPDGANASSS